LRDRLAEVWPPERSEAAMAFLQRVNDLVEVMTLTSVGAAKVHDGLRHVVDAIADARAELAPMVVAYENDAPLLDPRVVRQARKELDQRARAALMAADTTVRQASGMLGVALPAYERVHASGTELPMTDTTDVGRGDVGEGSGAATTQLATLRPAFDPPAPSTGASAGNSSGDDGSIGDIPDDDGSFSLAGDGTAQPNTQTNGSVIGRSGPTAPGSIDASTHESDPTRRGSTSVPGSVIGMQPRVPASGYVSVGPPVTGAAARPSPGTGPMTRRWGAKAVASDIVAQSHEAAAPGAYHDRSFAEYVARRRTPSDDQNETWPVVEGVAPVLESQPERRHDPGPGVLGIDR
jgi:hypothetical protein